MNTSHLIICPSCSGINKIPSSRIAEGGKCGKCHSLLLNGDVISANQALFNKYLTKSSLPIIVDFWASWCGPCKMMAPVFTQTAISFKHQAHFIKVNTETEQQLAAQFNIRSIPTLAVFKQGKEQSRQAGAMDANNLQHWVESQIN